MRDHNLVSPPPRALARTGGQNEYRHARNSGKSTLARNRDPVTRQEIRRDVLAFAGVALTGNGGRPTGDGEPVSGHSTHQDPGLIGAAGWRPKPRLDHDNHPILDRRPARSYAKAGAAFERMLRGRG